MKLDILAIGAHPDDVEISAGGTIAKHVNAGKTVGVVDLSRGELGTRGTADTRNRESEEAQKILGIAVRENLELPDGFFKHDKESIIKIVRQIRRFRPDIVLANAVHDRHPDHGRAGKLISDACFYAGLRKIHTEWEGGSQEAWRPRSVYHYIQDYLMTPDVIVDVTGHADTKMDAIFAYKTQFHDPDSDEPQTPISGPEFRNFLEGRMLHFGRLIKSEYGEGFTVDRPIGIDDLTRLL